MFGSNSGSKLVATATTDLNTWKACEIYRREIKCLYPDLTTADIYAGLKPDEIEDFTKEWLDFLSKYPHRRAGPTRSSETGKPSVVLKLTR